MAEKIKIAELERAFAVVMPLRDRREGDNSQKHLDVLNAALPKLLRLARAANAARPHSPRLRAALAAFEFGDER